jgi:hypothetical protein
VTGQRAVDEPDTVALGDDVDNPAQRRHARWADAEPEANDRISGDGTGGAYGQPGSLVDAPGQEIFSRRTELVCPQRPDPLDGVISDRQRGSGSRADIRVSQPESLQSSGLCCVHQPESHR